MTPTKHLTLATELLLLFAVIHLTKMPHGALMIYILMPMACYQCFCAGYYARRPISDEFQTHDLSQIAKRI